MAKKYDMEDDADDAHDPYESGSKDIAAQGFRKIPFGPDDKINHVIHNAYVKQANPKESENTKIHDIALHEQNSLFVSGKKREKPKAESI